MVHSFLSIVAIFTHWLHKFSVKKSKVKFVSRNLIVFAWALYMILNLTFILSQAHVSLTLSAMQPRSPLALSDTHLLTKPTYLSLENITEMRRPTSSSGSSSLRMRGNGWGSVQDRTSALDSEGYWFGPSRQEKQGHAYLVLVSFHFNYAQYICALLPRLCQDFPFNVQTYTVARSPAPVFRPIIHGLGNTHKSWKQLGHARWPLCIHVHLTHSKETLILKNIQLR